MSAHQQHILLVEDDEALAAGLSACLREGGFRVTATAGFEEALQTLEGADAVDLLITDVVMPGGVNGLALARMARLRRKDLPVIYMTGYSIPGLDRQAAGVVLQKPVDCERLLGEARKALHP
jgi:CheY-like chemotaxis protein